MTGIAGGSGGGGGYNYVQNPEPADPEEGEEWYDTGANQAFVYDGAAWIELTVTSHGALSDLSNDDHSQYATDTRLDNHAADAGVHHAKTASVTELDFPTTVSGRHTFGMCGINGDYVGHRFVFTALSTSATIDIEGRGKNNPTSGGYPSGGVHLYGPGAESLRVGVTFSNDTYTVHTTSDTLATTVGASYAVDVLVYNGGGGSDDCCDYVDWTVSP